MNTKINNKGLVFMALFLLIGKVITLTRLPKPETCYFYDL